MLLRQAICPRHVVGSLAFELAHSRFERSFIAFELIHPALQFLDLRERIARICVSVVRKVSGADSIGWLPARG
jgi:hypothetical protein